MNFKRYHVSKNLWAYQPVVSRSNVTVTWDGEKIIFSGTCTSAANLTSSSFVLPKGTYTLKANANRTPANNTYACIDIYNANPFFQKKINNEDAVNGTVSFTINSDTTISMRIRLDLGANYDGFTLRPMLNVGEESLPYEPYSSEVWHDTPHYIHNTSTDTITTPAVIYANDTTATVGLKGNMEQTGTPSPSSPIQPSECGDLETTGEHAGQYKIPISSASTTTPIYLGEVETERKIRKIDLGTLNWSKTASGNFWADTSISDCRTIGNTLTGNAICTHFTEVSANNVANTPYSFSSCLNTVARPFVNKTGFENLTGEEFKQAMSGVYMYYVLATPETAVVNEPIRKIGEYADTLNNVSIPVTAGGDTLSVGTTLQPSEVTATYKGWHPVADVHEYDSNYTIATMQALTIAQLQTHTISELQGGEWS